MKLINTIFNHFTDEQIEELIERVKTEPNDFVAFIRERQQALKELLQDPIQRLALECLNEIKELIDYRSSYAHPSDIRNDIDAMGNGYRFTEYHYTKHLDIINAIYDLNKEIQYCPDDYIIYFLEDIYEWSVDDL